MSEVTVLRKPAEEMDTLDQNFDLVYLDPPFGLQRDFNMVEKLSLIHISEPTRPY